MTMAVGGIVYSDGSSEWGPLMTNMGERMTGSLTLYVIYDHPSDHPDHWVMRPQHVGNGVISHGEAQRADSLEEARRFVPPFLHNLGRYEEDDPKIHEVWI